MITLPTTPGPVASDIRLVQQGGLVASELGGAGQIVSRTGARFACDVELPPMDPANSRAWFAALVTAFREGGRFTLRQVGLTIGTPGAPLVNGGSQTGQTLVIDGVTPGYVFRIGQGVHVATGGRRYFYPIAQAVTANGSGQASLTLAVPLRASPADNSPVEVAAPTIEGAIADGDPHLPFDETRLSRGMRFSITELR